MALVQWSKNEKVGIQFHTFWVCLVFSFLLLMIDNDKPKFPVDNGTYFAFAAYLIICQLSALFVAFKSNSIMLRAICNCIIGLLIFFMIIPFISLIIEAVMHKFF